MAARLKSTFIIMILAVIASGCASDGMMESSGSGSGSTTAGSGPAVSSSTKNIDRVASGSVEDTLNACLARIPKDATVGQKMLAEESCRRDHASRR